MLRSDEPGIEGVQALRSYNGGLVMGVWRRDEGSGGSGYQERRWVWQVNNVGEGKIKWETEGAIVPQTNLAPLACERERCNRFTTWFPVFHMLNCTSGT